MKHMTPDNRTSQQPSGRRLTLLKITSILLPFLLLLLIEGGLRLFHYGYNLDLFTEYPGDKNYMVFNPDASKRYFLTQQMATTGYQEPFLKVKDANTTRIFVLGESTTVGFPYFHNGSFHRWLQYRLTHEYPARHFEIINLSLTAVNSYTVDGFAHELMAYQPDAVLIYTGHNEYYGALGVCSTESLGGNELVVRSMLWLRESRLVQLLSNTYRGIRGWFSSGSSKDLAGKTRMELMVGRQEIPYGSSLYQKGIDQFRANMTRTLEFFHQQGVPVFLSEVLSNERDLRPFISPSVDSLRYPDFQKNFQIGLNALSAKDSALAYSAFTRANTAFGDHALCNFLLGRLNLGRGDTLAARKWLDKARDLDLLRFRAPSQINAIIHELSIKFDNVHLVPALSAFAAESPGGIAGNDLFLEHVHPNLKGYGILSDAFYQSIKKNGLPGLSAPGAEDAPFASTMDLDRLLREMPVTRVDSLSGAYRAHNLRNSWPFVAVSTRDSIIAATEEERLAQGLAGKELSWSDAMDQLYNYYISGRDLPDGVRVMEGLVLEHPQDSRYAEKTAMLYGEMKDYARAAFYFRESFLISPNFEKARYLFVLLLKLDQPEASIPFLDWAIRNNNSGQDLARVKQFTLQVIGLRKQLNRDSTSLPLLKRMADSYLKMGNADGASIYNTKVLRLTPGDTEAMKLKVRLDSLSRIDPVQ